MKMKKVYKKPSPIMKVYNMFVVDCDRSDGGRKGGLCLLWMAETEITILSHSFHHILARVRGCVDCESWDFCGLYGWSRTEDHGYTWDLIREAHREAGTRWICGGDFNEILYHFEKVGGNTRQDRRIQEFRQTIDDCNLMDLGYEGEPYTWTNKQFGAEHIQERLDRVFASSEWVSNFLGFKVHHLIRKSSDHCPLLLELSSAPKSKRPRRRPFRFEAMWLKDARCKSLCEQVWENGGVLTSPEDTRRKLESLGSALKQWDFQEFGNITKKSSELRKELADLQKSGQAAYTIREQKILEKEIDLLHEKEETMWKQRSRADWLAEGDRNTGFFHRVADGRKRRNTIKEILRPDGSMTQNEDEIEKVFRDYFEELFTSNTTQGSEEVLQAVEPVVTTEMNQYLTEPYTETEIIEALKQMPLLKAPGPDGMPVLFYTSCWNFVKLDLIPVLLSILNDGGDPSGFNNTFICLIPKKKQSKCASDFRPISLCNVVYKLISKVISNRLKTVLPDIINITQSAFVPGRHITDNALLAFEIFHMMKSNQAKAKGVFAFKLDMAKAYDRVEWSFLGDMMLKLGFHHSVVDLLIRCVSSVSFEVLINGSPGPSFLPNRGLRQGDPLSPYLFLLCAEALSSLLRRAETQKLIHGVNLCRTAPPISHLLFADDSIFFGRANLGEVDSLKRILHLYESVSGQKVNLEKSDISFSNGVPDQRRDVLANHLGVRRAQQQGKYLGIPSTIGRSKKEVFQMLIDRTRKKAKDWKRRFLSGAGKKVLIQSVLQSIPTYIMSCFLIPDQTCQQLNSVASCFFWGQKSNERKIHWKSWSKLCQRKEVGGLGLRDISLFNRAMLAKQAWRLIQHEDSLLARSLKARYFPRCDILQANIAHNPSFAWRSLLAGRDLLNEGIAWRVGNGGRIQIGIDRWIPNGEGKCYTARVREPDKSLLVKDFFSDDSDTWNFEKIEQIFLTDDGDKVSDLMLTRQNEPDKPFWPMGKGGFYTVRSGYHLAKDIAERGTASTSRNYSHLWKWIWKLDVIPKVKLFMWKCLSAALPTKGALQRRSIPVDPVCNRCGEKEETMEHALRDCEWAQFFWRSSVLRLEVSQSEGRQPMAEWFSEISNIDSSYFHSLFATSLWAVWFARNMLVFQDKKFSHDECFQIAHRAIFHKEKSGLLARQDQTRTIPCPAGWWKANCDASICDGQGVGVAVVFTDNDGAVMVCRYKFFKGAFTVEMGECLAIRESLLLAKEMGQQRVLVETDCQALYTKLIQASADISHLGMLLDEVKCFAHELGLVRYSWTRRDRNCYADRLAKYAVANRCFASFTGLLPVFVNSHIS